MKTKLVEFKNKEKAILRSILTLPKAMSDNAVIMCGGFERSATTEKKFKILADELMKVNIPSFRFDYSGCGLSDGNFSNIAIKKMTSELKKAIQTLKRKTKCKAISIVGHSLSTCVIAKLADKEHFNKIIFLAPALNQKELLRFWFIISAMKKRDPDANISWENYKDYFNEKEFQKDIQRTDKITKEHYIDPDYFTENSKRDYCDLIKNTANILLIHGNKDDKVPFESIKKDFINKLIVENGNHDMERPDMIKQWIHVAVNFIK